MVINLKNNLLLHDILKIITMISKNPNE